MPPFFTLDAPQCAFGVRRRPPHALIIFLPSQILHSRLPSLRGAGSRSEIEGEPTPAITYGLPILGGPFCIGRARVVE